MNEPQGERAGADPRHAFLIRTAELLHQYGTPSYRLERVMTKVSATLGVYSTYLYTPTALVVSIGRGDEERTYLRRFDSGEYDVGKLIAFDAILERLEAGGMSISEASEALEAAATAPPPHAPATTIAAAGAAAGSVALIFAGGATEIAVAAVLGAVLALVTYLTSRFGEGRGLLEPLAGFCVATASLLFARYGVPMDDRLATLAALVLLLPGLTLTVALTELALGHLAAGSARLAGAAVTLLTLVLGVSIAWRLVPEGMHPAGQFPFVVQVALPEWARWLVLPVASAAFGVLLKVPVSHWPTILAVSICGFVSNVWLAETVAAEVGAFCGALAVGCGGNLYARMLNRPAMAIQTPALLILVPGSVGYRSLTAMLESQTVHGIELAFSMVLIATSLVGGLLSANILLPPKRIL